MPERLLSRAEVQRADELRRLLASLSIARRVATSFEDAARVSIEYARAQEELESIIGPDD